MPNRNTLNIKGSIFSLNDPIVMGILNVTPDSFYEGSRKQVPEAIRSRIEQIINEGGKLIDIGGYSSRPDAQDITPKEEMRRLEVALKILRDYPNIPVSIDTFRSDVAKFAIEEYGADIINDISGGTLDEKMFDTVAQLKVPYILMHMRGTPKTMQQLTNYEGDMTTEIIQTLGKAIDRLEQKGVNDIIIDPGFGFSKTLDQNYELMKKLDEFEILRRPLLVGISRKSMIYKLFGTTPKESLNGTTILNTFALFHGAKILRVHDVRPAVEAIEIYTHLK